MRRLARTRAWGAARWRAIVLAATLAFGCGLVDGVPSVRGAGLSRLVARVATFASDGSRYVAWEAKHGSPIVVLDTRTGRRSPFVLPPGCGLEGQRERGHEPVAAAGRFLVACGIRQKLLLSAATGATRVLPASTGLHENSWGTVGARYVEGVVDAHACPQPAGKPEQQCIAIYDIATGVVSRRLVSELPDLARPGAPVICAKLRKKLFLAAKEEPFSGFAFADSVLVERAHHAGDVRVERCRGRPITLGGPGEPENFDPRAGLLTWDTGHPAEDVAHEEQVGNGWLFSYAFATHRRHHWALPRTSLSGEEEGLPTTGVFGYATHTQNMVLWIAARYCRGLQGGGCTTDTFSVYGTSS